MADSLDRPLEEVPEYYLNLHFKLALNPADFYLMNKQWDIAADNYIEFHIVE
jgi:hypothetical protein